MKVMNCDQVFDVLTRGPFPTGTPCDVPVEAHLSECPECHRLAEALRPALELFQEAVDPEESRDLPGYWSAPATDRQAAVSFAAKVESHRAATRAGAGGRLTKLTKNWTALTAWRMAAMLALGVTLGTLLTARMDFDGFHWSPLGADAATAPVAPRPHKPSLAIAERIELAALPAACYRNQRDQARGDTLRRDPLPAGLELAKLNCCSECHNAASDAVPRAATAGVAQSCQLCHHQPSRSRRN